MSAVQQQKGKSGVGPAHHTWEKGEMRKRFWEKVFLFEVDLYHLFYSNRNLTVTFDEI